MNTRTCWVDDIVSGLLVIATAAVIIFASGTVLFETSGPFTFAKAPTQTVAGVTGSATALAPVPPTR